MNDAFGRRINEGDIVVHATRQSSSQYLNVAKVIKTEDKRIRVLVLAGTNYHWQEGERKWSDLAKTYVAQPFEGYETWLHASGNVIVANGIDAMGIHDKVIAEQRAKLSTPK